MRREALVLSLSLLGPAAYSAELGPVSQADVSRFFEDLAALRLVELREPPKGK